ncbi:unannotated protein [freshwater metagenome]|uniref:Unannotated protein n=1 Tax=freshwater metagenome TaxID=449393 RepID=A0A6J7LG97_9ZZZZ
MSVLDRSSFSYQVAAGSSTSEKSPVDVMRKSIDTSRSSLPMGASSRQRISWGRREGSVSSAATALEVPSRCRRKYSLPLLDEPSRLARHTVSTRGQFSGASGSSAANFSVRSLSPSTTYCGTSWPAAAASSHRSSGLRSKVG